MSARLATALFGVGRIGAGYAADARMSRHYRYSSHAQVLRDHPGFDWRVAVDLDASALEAARTHWSIPETAMDIGEIADPASIEVAVLAVPPAARAAIIESLPRLKAVLVEKPLGETPGQAQAFLELCERRLIVVQVNLYRRADAFTNELAAGGLAARIGEVRCVTGFYGNGLVNNGTHMIDLVRMLVGEISEARGLPANSGRDNPLAILTAGAGVPVVLMPLDFAHFRENGLQVAGSRGRFDILLEGLWNAAIPVAPCRYAEGENELALDQAVMLPATVGQALWVVYDDLYSHLATGTALKSPGRSALKTARVVDSVMRSLATGGSRIAVAAG
jgi:predicted dehydrogenase